MCRALNDAAEGVGRIGLGQDEDGLDIVLIMYVGLAGEGVDWSWDRTWRRWTCRCSAS